VYTEENLGTIITKAYGPIIGMGAIGGTIIGVIVAKFGK